VRLFADGTQIAREQAPFEVYKSGFEQVVTAAAREHGVLYGLATAMMAVTTGWVASVVFRRGCGGARSPEFALRKIRGPATVTITCPSASTFRSLTRSGPLSD